MEKILADIRAFVAGEMSPHTFRDRVYADEEFEQFLKNDPHLRSDNYVKGNVYGYLLQLDFDDAGDILNAQGVLVEFMDRNGIHYTESDQYRRFLDLIGNAQPGWLDVPVKFVQEYILPSAGNRTGTKLANWLAEEFLKRFRFVDSPPEWIQSPAWPINVNGPLVFLGQLNVENYFHDSATAYVFHDPKTGICETVIQVF